MSHEAQGTGADPDAAGHERQGRAAPQRTGSYPLMNLAADFGVDYGDVLMMAEFERRMRVESLFTTGPFKLEFGRAANDAWHRIGYDLGVVRGNPRVKQAVERWNALLALIEAHARQRWGKERDASDNRER